MGAAEKIGYWELDRYKLKELLRLQDAGHIDSISTIISTIKQLKTSKLIDKHFGYGNWKKEKCGVT